MADTSNDKAYAAREMRARRAAKRQRLALSKSRTRDVRAYDYGTYMLIDPYTNTIVAGDGNSGYGMDLDAIERALNE
jgi:hypothetical protein